MSPRVGSLLGAPSTLWREGRAGLQFGSLLLDPVFRGNGVPAGAGQAVMLLPGYLAGDSSLWILSGWLRRVGYRPVGSGIRVNRGGKELLDRVSARLLERAERQGEPLAIVGQSLGGSLARALAVRHPDRVAGIVTLASPLLRFASGQFPTGVGFVSIFTREDPIIDWRDALDPAAEQVELRGTHAGMGVSAPAYRVIGRALGGFWADS